MALCPATVVSAPRPFGMRSCPYCGELVVAPEASEFVSDGEVRHIWSCESCGSEFETAVRMESAQPW